MIFRETSIAGCVEITPRQLHDERGMFVKTFHEGTFREHGIDGQWREEYYSVSHRGVLRGLHFQLPPHDHDKLVYLSSGAVTDVALDLRKGSPTFGAHLMLGLSAEKGNMLFLPRGVAHGFYVHAGPATMFYKVSSVYAPEHDAGILWNSAGIPWPLEGEPIISARDRGLQSFASFAALPESPFEYPARTGRPTASLLRHIREFRLIPPAAGGEALPKAKER